MSKNNTLKPIAVYVACNPLGIEFYDDKIYLYYDIGSYLRIVKNYKKTKIHNSKIETI